jgi:hypothetical protein
MANDFIAGLLLDLHVPHGPVRFSAAIVPFPTLSQK